MAKKLHKLRLKKLYTSNLCTPAFSVDFNEAGIIWLHGPQGTGKSTVAESVRMALMHKYWDDKGDKFSKIVRNGGELREAFAYGSGPMTINLGTTMGDSIVELDKRRKVEVKGFNIASAEGTHEDMAQRLRRSPQKMAEELASMALEDLNDFTITSTVNAAYQELFTTMWNQQTGSPVNRFVQLIKIAEGKAKRAKADIAALNAQQPNITPIEPDTKLLKRLQDELRLIVQQTSHASAWDEFDEGVESAKKWQEWLVAKQRDLARDKATLRQKSAEYDNQIGYYEALSAALSHYQWLQPNGLGVLEFWEGEWDAAHCVTVKTAIARELTGLKNRRDNDPDVAPLAAQVDQLERQINNNRQWAQLPDEPSFPRSTKNIEALKTEHTQLRQKVDNMLRMQGMWAQEARRQEQLANAEGLHKQWSDFVIELKKVRKELINEHIAEFLSRVNKYVPDIMGDRVFIDLDKARVGMVRDGIERTRLSGAEHAVFVAAFCLAAAETKPVPPLVILNDVNLHNSFIHTCCDTWRDYRGVIIVMSAMAPEKETFSHVADINASEITGLFPGSWKSSSVEEATTLNAEKAVEAADDEQMAAMLAIMRDLNMDGIGKKRTKKMATQAAKQSKYHWHEVKEASDLKDVALQSKLKVMQIADGLGGAQGGIEAPAKLVGVKDGWLTVTVRSRQRVKIHRETLASEEGDFRIIAYDQKQSDGVRARMVQLLTQRLGVTQDCPLLDAALTAELQAWVDGTLDETAFRTQHDYKE
jgi:energy-coupling factor transporter ATP-binding protein EcfA2